MQRFIFHISFFCLLYTSLYAQEHSNAAFIENKNQWKESIKFKTEFRGGAIYFEDQSITCVLQDRETVEKILHLKFSGSPLTEKEDLIVTYHAYKVYFNNTQQIITYKGEDIYPDYNNYYIGKDSKRWASNVRKYHSITYENLYKGIHLTYYEKNHSLKYEFLIEKEANPKEISMTYEGMDKLFLKKGNLHIQCEKNEVVELNPYAYQEDKSGNIIEIPCKYVLKGQTVFFKVGTYDTSLPLIIDPILIFCSYSGSSVDNWGYTATYDSEGNLYGGSSVFGGPGYPITLGAYQVNYGSGSNDIGIAKFNKTGDALLFSTYLGGNGSEVPHSLIVNDNDELYVLASTSSTNFAVTPNAYDTNFNGGSYFLLTNSIQYLTGVDIAIAKFNAGGTQLLGCTYYGGSGNDGLSTDTRLRKNYADEVRGEIMVDEFSNVYIVSSTASGNLPTSPSAYQRTYGGGKQDGFIAKFNYDLSNLIWASYLGGDSSDAIYSMAFDNNYNVYVCGGTYSRNLPTTSGVIQPTYAGGVSDGFIAKLSTNGDQLLHSTYYGKSGFDQTYLIKLDRTNSVYVMGLTDAPGTSWVQNAAWYNTNGGQFISKLSSNLSQVIWSTAFGTGTIGPDISPTALMVDLCKNIYISGWGSPTINSNIGNNTGGTRGLPITADAFQKTTDNNDFYFLSLSEDASKLVFATYFGGPISAEHVDGGTSRFDKKGFIYQAICSGCGGNQDLPVTPGVVSQTNNYINCNLGVVKIDFNLPAVVADFTCPNIICAPYIIIFENRSQVLSGTSSSYYWDFGDNTYSTLKNPSHLYSKSGIYKIKLIVSDTGSCNYYDTLIRELVVLSNSNDTLPTKYMCQGDFIQIGISPAANPNVSYSWLPKNGLNNSNIANPIASNANTNTYYLYISDGFCVDTFRQVVTVIPVYLDAGPRDTACLGDTIYLQATSYGGTEFVWSSNRNFTDTLNRPISNATGKNILTGTKMYYIKMSNKYCSLYDSVTIFASRIITNISKPAKFCSGDSVYLTATILSHIGGKTLNYNWKPTTSILSGATTYRPLIRPKSPTTYYLNVTNEHGCVSKDSVFVDVFSINYSLDIKHIRCYGFYDGHIKINLDSNSLPCTFQWDNHAGIGNKAENLPAGHYRVLISDTNNCVYEIDTILTQPTKINTFFFDTNTLVYCNDTCSGYASAGATGGMPPYAYWWITGDTTTSITDLCAGEYVFVVTDQNACEDTARITIVDTTNFNVTFLITHISCYGECDGSIALFASNGRPPYDYQWKNGYTKDTASNLCTGIYDVLVKDTARCSRRIFPTVKTPDPLVFTEIEMHQPSCYSYYNGKIIAHISGGTPPYRFYWDDVPGNDTLANLGEGTYRLKVIDTNNCEIDTALILLQFDSLDVSYTVIKTPCVEVCYGEAIIEVDGGNPPYSFDWSNGDTTNHPKRLCYGEHTVNIIDSNGCKKILHIFVGDSSYFPQKVKAWTDSSVIYRSQSTTLYATKLDSGYTYKWSPNDNLSNPTEIKTIATPTNTTTYTITVTDKYGCTESDTITIFVLDVNCGDPYVFVPNAFTPNNDGNNDVLYVRGKLLTDVYLIVFDRWGEKVFETKDINVGWNGTYKGKDCAPGVFVYYLEATCLGEIYYFHKGNVTLIR